MRSTSRPMAARPRAGPGSDLNGSVFQPPTRPRTEPLALGLGAIPGSEAAGAGGGRWRSPCPGGRPAVATFSAPAEGELFVPFTLLPAGQGAAQDDVLVVRVKSVVGLQTTSAPRLSLGFRFGTMVEGDRIDKAKEASAKCQLELVRDRNGSWLPEAGTNGIAKVVLPPLLLTQSGRGGVACRVKVSVPGYVTASVLAVSEPMPVPFHPSRVTLVAPKSSQGKSQTTPVATAATAMLSISRLFSAEAQVVMAKSLVQQILSHIRRPAEQPASSASSARQAAALTALDALRPCRGWLPSAGVAHTLAAVDGQNRSALRLAVDEQHWDCIRPLVEVRCDPRSLASDVRSPLTVVLEQGGEPELLDALVALPGAGHRANAKNGHANLRQVVGRLAGVLSIKNATGGTAGDSSSDVDERKTWEALAKELASMCRTSKDGRGGDAGRTPSLVPDKPAKPPPSTTASTEQSDCDLLILALDHCPSGKARRELLCADGACAALWRCSLSNNLPELAKRLAVWIGLSTGGSSASNGTRETNMRKDLLDARFDYTGTEDVMLACAFERATQDERWVRVARVLVNLGACKNAVTSEGLPLIAFAFEQADKGHRGFRELLASLLEKLGADVNHWERPTVLLEERTAECPICLESLWTATPTAFVGFKRPSGNTGGEGSPHVICAHFFCFDCASQQYMKQQGAGVSEYHCPICRAPANEVMPLPDIAVNPQDWFHFLDMKRCGQIDRNTLVQALEAMLPLDTEYLREAMSERCWAEWGRSQNDFLTEQEFFARGGLLEWVRAHQHELQMARARGPSPPLDKPQEWFRHWDLSKRGTLHRGTVLRALCEAAQISSLQLRKIKLLQDGIQVVWDRHAAADDSLSRSVFVKGEVHKELLGLVRDVQ